MAAFKAIFGETLKSKTGDKPTVEALNGKTGVLVYFSAHWCPPCRGFTPKLAEFYKKHAAAKGFEIVFVSSDRDTASFTDYYNEMPWLALPYDDRKCKEELNSKYKVKGIPSLVVLGPDGNVITTDGRSKVQEDFETCEDFPWKPPSFWEALGESFIKKDGSSVGMEAIKGKTLGLYFSAHWCPPCRGFTPKLAEFYKEYKALNENFEIVFVSDDKDEGQMLSYFKEAHGEYLALPFEKRKAKNALNGLCGVDGIPTFAIVGPDGTMVNNNARGKVAQGAKVIAEEGWEPPLVGDFAEGPEVRGTDINETPTIVVICDKCDKETQKRISKALEPVAQRYVDEAKADGDDLKYICLLGTGGDGLEQVKKLTQNGAGAAIEAAGTRPVVLLFDIPDNGGFYLSNAAEVTTAGVEAFISSKEAGSETRLQLG